MKIMSQMAACILPSTHSRYWLMTWNLLIQLVYLPSCIHINLYLRCRSVAMDKMVMLLRVYRLHHYQVTSIMNPIQSVDIVSTPSAVIYKKVCRCAISRLLNPTSYGTVTDLRHVCIPSLSARSKTHVNFCSLLTNAF